MAVPFQKLPNGANMPRLGFGTWLSKPGEVTDAVKKAIDIGYRHIDTARAYQNEKEVGVALNAKLTDGTVKREDLFVVTKLWNVDHHPEDVKDALLTSLKDLQLQYLDLYLIHWPMAYVRGKGMFPKDENGKIRYSDTDFTDTWKAMELLVDEGLCKAIGLSNFNRKQVDRVSAIARVPVSVLQVECNPYLTQEDLVSYCESKNIVMTAYSPLGSPARPWIKEEDPFPLKDPIVGTIAKAHNKTPAQVLIHFQLQRGLIVLAKSVTPARIKENFEVLDFELSSEEMKAISGLNRNYRGCLLEWLSDHEHHPFFKNGERTDDCK